MRLNVQRPNSDRARLVLTVSRITWWRSGAGILGVKVVVVRTEDGFAAFLGLPYPRPMPEGHTIHRIAKDHTKLLVGRPVAVSSPQGRFQASADLVNGVVLERIEPYASTYTII